MPGPIVTFSGSPESNILGLVFGMFRIQAYLIQVHSNALYWTVEYAVTTMHIGVEENHSGWFPAIGIQFARFSDLLIAATVLGAGIFILLYLTVIGRRMLGKITTNIILISLGLIYHIITIITESIILAYNAVYKIPIPWYPVAALTVIPMAIDIPRWAGVLYLLAYCVTNAWVLASGIKQTPAPNQVQSNETIEEEGGKQSKKKDNNHASSKLASNPSITRNQNAQATHLFTGMRITIQS